MRGRMDSQSTENITEGQIRRARIAEYQARELRRLRMAGGLGRSGLSASARDDIRASSNMFRHRLRRYRDGDYLSETVQEVVDRLNEPSPSRVPLLVDPVSQAMNPNNIMASEYSGEAEVNRRRPKRRKMDTEDSITCGHGFNYGYRGQVVPGPLKMSIVSCSGGQLTDGSRDTVRDYGPANVLRNDKSVYCTEHMECSIVLRHFDETPFCLTKVIIKAPQIGFTAPVQEGMIFVSMTSDDILERTAHYHVQETPPTRSTPNHTFPDPVALERYSISDPIISERWHQIVQEEERIRSNEHRPPSRRAGPSSTNPLTGRNAYIRSVARRAAAARESRQVDHTHEMESSLFARSHLSPRPMSPEASAIFNVMASCEDVSGDEEEETSPSVLADLRNRRDHEQLHSSGSDDEDDEHPFPPQSRRALDELRSEPQKFAWTPPEGPLGRRVEMLQPHAKFFIEQKKNMVCMKFDPPVSGKFILFKLWSPVESCQIDIQSLTAYGYGGPRFFPATKMM